MYPVDWKSHLHHTLAKTKLQALQAVELIEHIRTPCFLPQAQHLLVQAETQRVVQAFGKVSAQIQAFFILHGADEKSGL